MPKIPEAALKAMEAAKHPKETALSAIGKARETIFGSGSIRTELADFKDAYLDTAKAMITTPPKALWDLVRLHPIDAVKTTADGIIGTLKGGLKMAKTPVGLGVAGAENVKEGAKAVAGKAVDAAAFIPKSPFMAFGMIKRGIVDNLWKLGGKVKSWDDAGWSMPKY